MSDGWQLTGVYGDMTDAAGQDSELIPLLRQLIAMLEAGGPFYLTPDFLNFINNGCSTSSNTNNITNINISGLYHKQQYYQYQYLRFVPQLMTLPI